jgi:hypothetical protein
MIIGLIGFISSGKGTVGDLLESKGFYKDSFATPLKDACSVMFGWPRELLEGDTEVSRSWREQQDSFWSEKFGYSFSPRLALQLMGTEAGRDVFHKDIWVISLLNRSKNKDVVVTDVRFKNEIEYIQNNGGIVVRIKRGEDPEWVDSLTKINTQDKRIEYMEKFSIHQSEWDWVGCDFNYEIANNGTIEELGNRVDSVLHSIGK